MKPNSSFIQKKLLSFLSKKRWCQSADRLYDLLSKYPVDLDKIHIETHWNGWTGANIKGPKFRLRRFISQIGAASKRQWEETWAYIKEEDIPEQYRKPEYEFEMYWDPSNKSRERRQKREQKHWDIYLNECVKKHEGIVEYDDRIEKVYENGLKMIWYKDHEKEIEQQLRQARELRNKAKRGEAIVVEPLTPKGV